ncbi:unnamed protein product [Symbiodinium microadriaticum]|nr:unnamed protein product [Symbiodinium microadriaticum]CAE7424212.1 unnamed protein product [Symbiodinium sp. KB8]
MPAPLAQELFVARTLKEVEDAFLLLCPEPDKSTAITIRKIFHKIDVPSSRRAFLREKALKFYKIFEHKQFAWSLEERQFLMDSFITGCCDADVETSSVDRWMVVRQLLKKRKHVESTMELGELKRQREELELSLLKDQQMASDQESLLKEISTTILKETYHSSKEKAQDVLTKAMATVTASQDKLSQAVKGEVEARFSIMEVRKAAKELPPAWLKLAANKNVVLLMDFNLMEESEHLPDITASALGLLPTRVLHARKM